MLSVSGCAGGCSKQAEPVIADATVETPEPEESIETKEPTPSPTVEPTEEPVEDNMTAVMTAADLNNFLFLIYVTTPLLYFL